MTTLAGDHYIVISSDGHAGAQVHEYRDYLESKYHDEFDTWASTFVNPFEDLRADVAYRNWESAARLRELEDDGVVAEVLFPNTIPPFFPSGNLLACPPADDEYELRWAGLKAHNRWLVDFCADTPGRRAGMAQVFLNDVDAAVAEVEWGAEQGLRGGILLPGVPPDSGLPPLYSRAYDRLWAACQDHEMPINNHSGAAGPAPEPDATGMAVFMIELAWFSHRVFWHMVVGGAFARYPGIRLILTEQSSGWVPGTLGMLDHQFRRFRDPNTAESHFGARGGQDGDRAAEPLLAHELLRGSELLPSVRDATPPRDRRRPHHVGPGLPAHRVDVPVHHRGAAQQLRRCRPATRWRAWSGSTRPRSTASTSTRSRRWPNASVRPSKKWRRRSTRSRPTRARSPSRARA